MVLQLGPSEQFEDENAKLKETKFEDLPLLINEMQTEASKINFNNILAGKEERASVTDNKGTLVKQIDENEFERLASKMSVKEYRKPNDIEPDKVLEDLYSQKEDAGKIVPAAQTRPYNNPDIDKRLEDAFSAIPEKEEL